MLIVDGHEDIAWNMLTLNRDYTKSALATRRLEQATWIPQEVGSTLLGKSEWLLGKVCIIFASLFATPLRRRLGDWDILSYASPTEAHASARRQLDAYHHLIDTDPLFRLVTNIADLDEVLGSWSTDLNIEDRLIGFVPLMEGADGIQAPSQLEEWYERGLRIIGPAWASTRYTGGTGEPGSLTPEGVALLNEMSIFNFILDVSHMAEQAFYESLDQFDRTIIASHSNPRKFLPTDRGLSDDMIRSLADRGGVVGVIPYNRFLIPGWRKSDQKPGIQLVADVIDHICQLTGSSQHVAIGSDFDGLFGVEQVPHEIDTINDLQKVVSPLEAYNYSLEEIDNIMHTNWLRILRQALPPANS